MYYEIVRGSLTRFRAARPAPLTGCTSSALPFATPYSRGHPRRALASHSHLFTPSRFNSAPVSPTAEDSPAPRIPTYRPLANHPLNRRKKIPSTEIAPLPAILPIPSSQKSQFRQPYERSCASGVPAIPKIPKSCKSCFRQSPHRKSQPIPRIPVPCTNGVTKNQKPETKNSPTARSGAFVL